MHHLLLYIHLHLVCAELLNIFPENRNIIHFHNFWIIEIFSKTENTASFYRPLPWLKGPDNCSEFPVMGNTCADLMGMKMGASPGDQTGCLLWGCSRLWDRGAQRQSGKTNSWSRLTTRPRRGVGGTDDFWRDKAPLMWPSDGLVKVFPGRDRSREASRIHISGMCLFFQQAFWAMSHLWKETCCPHLFSL